MDLIFCKFFKLNTLFYNIVRFTLVIMENNIILLNVFLNNRITNLVSKQYKTLSPNFLITFYLSSFKTTQIISKNLK